MDDIHEKENTSPAAPRMYIERGINRHTGNDAHNLRRERLDAENRPLDNPLSEYRAARLAAEAEAQAAQREETEEQPSEDNRADVSSKKFTRRAARRRELAEDEEPPLLDSLADAVEERYNRRRDFIERYELSPAGTSDVRTETEKAGAVVRQVEYFVPKLSGAGADEINYGKGKAARTSRNRNPMRRWQRASVAVTCFVLVFVMILGVMLSTMLNRMNFVDTAQKAQNAPSVQDMAADKAAQEAAQGIDDSAIELPDAVMFDADIENVLLIGSDRRTLDEDGRSDAMMLLTLDRKHKKIKMTSFLRDLYIRIPGRYGTKLNSSYAVGGVDLLKQTIEANLGITVDKYIIIDFNAFKTVVNKIGKLNGKGGIKITVTSAEANYMCHHEKYGLFPRFEKGKGTYYMNGAEALNYARIRKIDSDFGRTKRQRKVLTEIINELKDLSYMDLINIGYSCLEYVTTDFTKGELVGLASEAASVMNYGNAQISIPISGSYTVQHMSNGSEVLAANLKVNSQILTDFIYNDDMTYEGNNKEVHGIFLPDLKGIANANVTTKSTTATTTAATTAATTTATAADGSTVTTTAAAKTLEIVGSNVIVRSKNNSSSEIVTRVQNGERYTYTEQKGNWFHIQLPSGKSGWVYANYVIQINNVA